MPIINPKHFWTRGKKKNQTRRREGWFSEALRLYGVEEFSSIFVSAELSRDVTKARGPGEAWR